MDLSELKNERPFEENDEDNICKIIIRYVGVYSTLNLHIAAIVGKHQQRIIHRLSSSPLQADNRAIHIFPPSLLFMIRRNSLGPAAQGTATGQHT